MSDQAYKELTLPNITYAEIERQTQRKVSGVSTFMYPVIETLALRHPEWEFQGSDSNRLSQESIEVRGFRIFNKRELLGKIETVWFGREYAYGIRNERISHLLERGYQKKTTKADKAIKLVEKHFYNKNTNELYDEAKGNAEGVLGRFVNARNMSLESVWRKYTNAVRDFIMLHFNEFVSELNASDGAEFGKIPDMLREYRYVSNLYKAFKTGGTYNVVLQGMDYLVGEGDDITIISSEQIPAELKRKLGMLKLIQSGDAVENNGIRVNESVYILDKGE